MTGQDRIPSLHLPNAAGEARAPLRTGRGPGVVLALHHAACDGCRRYLRELASSLDQLADWDGSLTVVVPADPAAAAAAAAAADVAADVPAPARVLWDEEGRLGEAGTLLVADEWGSVYHRAEAGVDHAFPSADEVVEWARFIAIQCPECEGPEGPWRAMAP